MVFCWPNARRHRLARVRALPGAQTLLQSCTVMSQQMIPVPTLGSGSYSTLNSQHSHQPISFRRLATPQASQIVLVACSRRTMSDTCNCPRTTPVFARSTATEMIDAMPSISTLSAPRYLSRINCVPTPTHRLQLPVRCGEIMSTPALPTTLDNTRTISWS